MGIGRDERGFTLVEALVAIAILVVALVALMALLSRGSLNVAVGGGQTKAVEYARQQVEILRNWPINAPCPGGVCFPPANGADVPRPCATCPPENGITRSWTIAPVGATVTPNRLWSITVTVTVTQASQMAGGQNITLQTMRSECLSLPSC